MDQYILGSTQGLSIEEPIAEMLIGFFLLVPCDAERGFLSVSMQYPFLRDPILHPTRSAGKSRNASVDIYIFATHFAPPRKKIRVAYFFAQRHIADTF